MRTHAIPGYRSVPMTYSASRSAESDAGVRSWEALLRVHAALVPILAGEVEEATGLPLPWYDVLIELNSAPGRQLRMQDLGERVVLSRTRVSRIVDDMIQQRLVIKDPDPTDGRATLATITPEGRRALRRAAPVYLNGIKRHFSSHLELNELNTIQAGLHRILARYDMNRISRPSTRDQ